MAVKEVPFYVGVCDRCGREANQDDYGDYSAWEDPATAIEMLVDGDEWLEINGRLLCEKCWLYDDEGAPIEVAE